MRTQVILSPIGQRFPAISIPGVDQIRGVLIDNPSGSWLLLRPTNDYIPPYTIGWARSFMGGIASIDIAYESPAGQVATLAGDAAIVVLDTEPIPENAGSSQGNPFIERFTPVLTSILAGGAGLWVATSANTSGTWIAATANRRIRILTISIGYLGLGIFPGVHESPLELMLIDSATLNPVQYLQLTVMQRQIPPLTFPEGLDLTVGARLDYQARAYWADVFISGSITYQLI